MNLRIIIPARAPQLGKTRLAGALPPSQRTVLGQRLFRHVLQTAIDWAGAQAVHVISRSPEVLAQAEALGAHGIAEHGDGLNAALEQAVALLAGSNAPVITLSADLPLLAGDDLAALIAAGTDIACATDTAADGTNALFQRRPGLIPFRYGPGSLAAHRAAALERGLAFSTIRREGLAFDVDTPADLAALAPRWLAPAGQPGHQAPPTASRDTPAARG